MLSRSLATLVILLISAAGAGFTQTCNRFSITFVSPAPGFTAFIDQKNDVQIQVNECGSNRPVTSGSVVINFSNLDQQLVPTHMGNGLWTSTWTPVHAVDGEVDLTVFVASFGVTDGNQVAGMVHPAAPPLTFDKSTIVFETTAGGAIAAQTVKVFNNSASPQDVSVAAAGGPWIAASPLNASIAGGGSLGISVSADPGNLPIGVTSGSITVQSSASRSASLLVTTSVAAPIAPPQLTSDTYTLSITLTEGGPSANRPVTLTNSNGTAVNFQAQVDSSWLAISPMSGAIPARNSLSLPISFLPGALTPGQYSGAVKFSTSSGQLITIIVALTIQPRRQALPSLAVDRANLTFAANESATTPIQTVQLSNQNAVPVAFTATVSKPWLHLDQPSGIVPANGSLSLHVSASSVGLSVGSYNEFVTVATVPPGGAAVSDAPTVQVNAAFTVSVPVSAGSICKRLLAVFRSPGADATVKIGDPVRIGILVSDECGIRPNSLSIALVSFSNGDGALPLRAVGDGIYEASWIPSRGLASQTVLIKAQVALVQSNGLVIATEVTETVTLARSTAVPQVGAIVGAATFAGTGAASPGELVAIFGRNLADCSARSSLPLPVQSCGTQIFLNGKPVPLLFVSSSQINLQIPFDAPIGVEAQFLVQRSDTLSLPVAVAMIAALPAIFTANQAGTGQGVVVNFDTGRIADSNSPLTAGSVFIMYCTGLGTVLPAVPAGVPVSTLARTVNPVTLTIGGQSAQVIFAGLVPGYVGLYQVNAVVPSRVAPGSAVPIILQVADRESPPATVAVK